MSKRRSQEGSGRRSPLIDFASSFGDGDEYWDEDTRPEVHEYWFRLRVRGFYRQQAAKPLNEPLIVGDVQKDCVARSACNALLNEVYYSTGFPRLSLAETPNGRDTELLFWDLRLRVPDESALNVPALRRRIRQAFRSSDDEFFIRLGAELSKEPVRAKLNWWLAIAWVPRPPNEHGLCDFSDDALAKYGRLVLGNRKLNAVALGKQARRMGLVRRKGHRVFGVKRGPENTVFLLNRAGRRICRMG